MKNTEIAFYSFKQFGYLLLHIGGNEDSVEVFRLFSIYLKNNVFKYLKNQNFFWQFQVMFHIYLGTRRDDDNDYNDRESSDEDYCE